MKARAAVAWAPQKPLEIEEVDVMGPKEGEVLLKVIALCRTLHVRADRTGQPGDTHHAAGRHQPGV